MNCVVQYFCALQYRGKAMKGPVLRIHIELLQRGQGSKRWLAEQLHVSQSYVSLLLSDGRCWTERLKTAASQVLAVPVDELFTPVMKDTEEVQSG